VFALGEAEFASCRDVEVFVDMLHIALRPLYEFYSSACLGCGIGFDLFMAVARLFLVSRFGEPGAEGLYCYTGDEKTCYRYVMMYRCVEGDQERVAEVLIEDDYEYGLHIHSFSYREPGEHLAKHLKPVRLLLTVEKKVSSE